MKRINIYKFLQEELKDLIKYNIKLYTQSEGSITLVFKNFLEDQELFVQKFKNYIDENSDIGNYDLFYYFRGNLFIITCKETFYEVELKTLKGRGNRLGYIGVKSKDYNNSVCIQKEINTDFKKEVCFNLEDILNQDLIPVESIISIREAKKNSLEFEEGVRLRFIINNSKEMNFVNIFNKRLFTIEKISPRSLKTLKEFGFNIFVTSWEYFSTNLKNIALDSIDSIGKDIFDDNLCLLNDEIDDDAYLPTLYFTENYMPIILEDSIEKSVGIKGIPKELKECSESFEYWDKIYYQLNYSYIDAKYAILTYMLEKSEGIEKHLYKYRLYVYKCKSKEKPLIIDTEPIIKCGDEWLSHNLHYTLKGFNGIPLVKDLLRFKMNIKSVDKEKYLITLPSIDIIRDTITNRVYKSNDMKYLLDISKGSLKELTNEEILSINIDSTDKEKFTQEQNLSKLEIPELLVELSKEFKFSKEYLENTKVLKDKFLKERLQGKILIRFPKISNIDLLKKFLTLRSAQVFSVSNKGDSTLLKFNGFRDAISVVEIGSLYNLLIKEGYSI